MHPLEGLGTDMATLRRLCHDDKEALDLLDKAVTSRQGQRTDLVNNVNDVEPEARPMGNSAACALRALRAHRREDLHKRVLLGRPR
jgi:hypothetical protein